MKRTIIFASVIFGVLAAVLLALPFVVSPQNIKTILDQRILELTGETVSYKGEPRLSFIPYLGVEVNDVILAGNRLNDDEPELLRIENLQFQLKVFPLFFGKVSISKFRLTRPKIKILVRKNGSSNWNRFTGKIDSQQNSSGDNQVVTNASRSTAASIANLQIGRIEIVDGILETNISRTDSSFRVSNLQVNVNWPDLSSPWDISGNGVWRGEVFEFSNQAKSPLALIRSGKSELNLVLSSPTLSASFDGQATVVSDLQLQGKTTLSTPSLPRLLELLLKDEPITELPVGTFSIRGEMLANSRELRFSKTDIELDKNSATGNLQLNWNKGKKPKISGTLAFSTLELSPLIQTIAGTAPAATESNGSVARQRPFDLDVRFSAKNYEIRSNRFGALAATIIVNDNEWSFDIGEADFFGGVIMATIGSNSNADTNEIELKGIMRNVSMGDLSRDWYGGDIVATGAADVEFSLKAPGDTALGNVRKFFGSMNIALTNGEITGVDLVKAIPALNQYDGFVTVEDISGVTPFNNLSLDLLIYNGVGWITSGSAKAENNEFQLSGKADILGGGLAVYADIRQISTDGSIPRRERIFVGGTVKNPLVTRSPLAANRPDG